ncbi:MAG: hypothetical protein ACJA13_001546 [Paraglaciecola sp.]
MKTQSIVLVLLSGNTPVMILTQSLAIHCGATQAILALDLRASVVPSIFSCIPETFVNWTQLRS